ncbi:hypothetical protein OIU77_005406 [Salix suchowensis]|uniref:Protein ENHANCED DISEASE RESISTANCE 2 C-terminal domain-containing protein n=1 Tax=Salix suchowensis TaxID=1278906 RepID=A0ABQ9APA9_9ROSI|nr:hypothetical protein OIU77_005406 [Salix suchowensis]
MARHPNKNTGAPARNQQPPDHPQHPVGSPNRSTEDHSATWTYTVVLTDGRHRQVIFSLSAQEITSPKNRNHPSGDYLFSPAGMDWLKSSTKLDNVLGRSDNRVANALKKAQSQNKSLKSFIFAINLQVPGKDQHSAVFYFASEDPLPSDSLLYRFINGDDAFRNQRFKIVNRIVKGPWVVKKAVGSYSACLLGKALNIHYHRGRNYFEIDVDVGSSKIAAAILHLALGYTANVTIDMGFVVEAQAEEELPEKLIGAIRVCQMEMSSARVVDAPSTGLARGSGFAKVEHHLSGDEEED